jgi:hypothetical protein
MSQTSVDPAPARSRWRRWSIALLTGFAILVVASVWFSNATGTTTYVQGIAVLPGGQRLVADCIRRLPDFTTTQDLFLFELSLDGMTVQKSTRIPTQRVVVSNVYELSPQYWLLVDELTQRAENAGPSYSYRLCVLRTDTWEYTATQDIALGGSPATILRESDRTLIVHQVFRTYRVGVAPETGELLSLEHIPPPKVASDFTTRFELSGRNAAGEPVLAGRDHFNVNGRNSSRKSVYLWRVGKEQELSKAFDLPGKDAYLTMSRDGSVFLAGLEGDALLLLAADGRELARHPLWGDYRGMPGVTPTSFLVFSPSHQVQIYEVEPDSIHDISGEFPDKTGWGTRTLDPATATLYIGARTSSMQAEVRRFRRGNSGWEALPSIPIPR